MATACMLYLIKKPQICPGNVRLIFLFLQLSLRENPLVVRFVQEMNAFKCPSLLELAGRAVKSIPHINPTPEDLPRTLLAYLKSANCCVNPKCKGKSRGSL